MPFKIYKNLNTYKRIKPQNKSDNNILMGSIYLQWEKKDNEIREIVRNRKSLNICLQC